MNEKATILGLLTTGVASIYGAIAIFAGEHWALESDEAGLVATRLNDALATLPTKYYVFIKSYTENVAPWIALALAIYAVTADRIEESIRQSQQKAVRSAQGADSVSDYGTGPTGSFDSDSRFAYPIVEPDQQRRGDWASGDGVAPNL